MSLLDNFFNTKQPAYMQGLLGDSGSADLQNTANTTGLVNMALGYLAAPKHQQLGLGRILAGSYMAGQQGAQGTYDNALNNWKTQNTIDDYNKAKAKETGLQNAMNLYGVANDNQTTAGAPATTQNVPAPQGTDAPNFNLTQQTTPEVAPTQTPFFNNKKWMASVLPNLDAKEALSMLTKVNKSTWIDGGDKLYQADESGNLTGISQEKGMAKAFHTIDGGGKTYITDGTNITGSIDKSQTPDSMATDKRVSSEGVLNRDVTLRGQNLVDGRAKDAQKLKENAVIDPDSRVVMAAQYLAGDKSVLSNIGRGTQGAQNIVLLRQEITKQMKDANLTGAQVAAKMGEFTAFTAAQRTVGTKSANIEMAATEASSLIPLARQASNNLPRSGLLPFGKAQIMFNDQTNDPALRQFAAANNSLVNVYARAISPQGVGTVADKEHARAMLSTAHDQASYNATLDQMQREIEAAQNSPKTVKQALSNNFTGKKEVTSPTPSINNETVLTLPAKPSTLTLKKGALYQTESHGVLRWNGKTYEDR